MPRVLSRKAQIARAAAAVVEKEEERKRVLVEIAEKEAEGKRRLVESREKAERREEHKERLEKKVKKKAEPLQKSDGKRVNSSLGEKHSCFLRASIYVLNLETMKWKRRKSNWTKSNVFDELLTPHQHKFADFHLVVDRSPRGQDPEAVSRSVEMDHWVQTTAREMNESRFWSDTWNHKQAIWSNKFTINDGDLQSRIKLHWVIPSD
ncbi:MAG: hypothetical protein Harvfovirus31_6 [Harvfovirus sp.]|uniref:Uncharacterized protein n=1 Tax=Harvfovirus sp. TaxID=2487768 RepID=A0A3G5A2N1_9VIRU|nr:MAG: hypothetical protein Harvfovirus31_6 [Harvfovirus sp.]